MLGEHPIWLLVAVATMLFVVVGTHYFIRQQAKKKKARKVRNSQILVDGTVDFITGITDKIVSEDKKISLVALTEGIFKYTSQVWTRTLPEHPSLGRVDCKIRCISQGVVFTVLDTNGSGCFRRVCLSYTNFEETQPEPSTRLNRKISDEAWLEVEKIVSENHIGVKQ